MAQRSVAQVIACVCARHGVKRAYGVVPRQNCDVILNQPDEAVHIHFAFPCETCFMLHSLRLMFPGLRFLAKAGYWPSTETSQHRVRSPCTTDNRGFSGGNEKERRKVTHFEYGMILRR
jgi:hypothetical protein